MFKSSSHEPSVFIAHQLCPPHLRQLVEDTVKSFDDKWLLPPVEGELFDSGKACLACLQGFALSQGFAVVTTASKAKRFRFAYIYYGGKTKNWRKLEQHMEKDLESGEIVSKRQRDSTSKQARDCPWEIYWSLRSVGKRGSGEVTGQLGISKATHNHILSPNPFIYKVYQKATYQYQDAVKLALGHRLAYQPYSAMRRVLDTSGLSIDRNTYYNLVHSKPLGQSNDSFEGLVFTLEEGGFRFNYLIANELAEDDSCKKRILE